MKDRQPASSRGAIPGGWSAVLLSCPPTLFTSSSETVTVSTLAITSKHRRACLPSRLVGALLFAR
jgi:hypothetical protein